MLLFLFLCAYEHMQQEQKVDHLNVDCETVNMVRCELCRKTFSWDVNLQRHKKTIHSKTMYQCPACARLFNRKDSYYRHKKTHRAHARFGRDIGEPMYTTKSDFECPLSLGRRRVHI